MSISVRDFWKLAIESQLLSAADCQRLAASFAAQRGAAEQTGGATLAEWLVSTGAISKYQARILLAGRKGPFVFGEYRINQRIESGRLAGRFRAVHSASGHPVLLYFFTGQQCRDPRRWAGIEERARWAIAPQHPHLCRVYELVDLNAYKFLALEALSGQSLVERCAGQRIGPAEACQFARQMALAMTRLEALGQAHGDIRPANAWLDRARNVKLLWFPWTSAAVDEAADPADRLGAQADYLAPELVQSGSVPDALSDVYGLGCTLYELLAGRAPFHGGDVADKLRRHATEAIEPLDRIAGADPALAQIVTCMMAKNPRLRIEGAAAVAQALAPFVPTTAPPARTAPSRALMAYEQTLCTRSLGPGAAPPAASGCIETAAAQEGGPPTPPPVQTAAHGLAPEVAGATVAAPPVATTNIAAEDLGIDEFSSGLPRRRSARARRSKKKRWNANLIVLGVLAALSLVATVELAILKPWVAPDEQVVPARRESPRVVAVTDPAAAAKQPAGSPDGKQTGPGPIRPVAFGAQPSAPQVVSARPGKPQFEEVDDDGQSLWVSPTKGPAFDQNTLKYLPSGPQLLLMFRPAEIMTHPEGMKILAALEPAGSAARGELESITGVPLDRVEQLIVAFSADDLGPQASLVVRLREAAPEAQLLAAWKNPAPAQGGAQQKYFVGPDWAYCITPEGQGQVIAIAPPAAMQALLERTGAAFVQKEIEKLLRDTDGARHFTLILAPSFLLTEGRAMLAGDLEKLGEPLSWFLGGTATAALGSFHLGPDLFIELRVYGTLDQDPYELAKQYRDRLGKISDRLESYIAAMNPHPYGKLILLRLPRMVQLLQDFTRVDVENNQSVLRCYLPGPAGHNLALGAELALLERPGAPASVASSSPKPSVSAALKQKISLSFSRDTLEKCMELLAKEIDAEIVILGGDLQLDGITKNQSFGLDEHDRPAEEILRSVMMKANPDGKLIYVIKPKSPGQQDAIFITTRSAAARRGDPLPPELQLPTQESKKKR